MQFVSYHHYDKEIIQDFKSKMGNRRLKSGTSIITLAKISLYKKGPFDISFRFELEIAAGKFESPRSYLLYEEHRENYMLQNQANITHKQSNCITFVTLLSRDVP